MGIIKESGKSVYIDDTWRLEKGQKVGDYTGRELDISDDVAATESTGWVEGKYESIDGSWKGSGTCTYIDKDGDELYESWEEDSNKGTYKTPVARASTRGPVVAAPTRLILQASRNRCQAAHTMAS